jgi:hypothetical protein
MSNMVNCIREVYVLCTHHSVRISDSNIDNMKTLYHLRRLSRHSLDYTLYTMKTGQLDNIQWKRETYPPNQHLILHSDAIGFSRLPFYKQIQWIQYGLYHCPLYSDPIFSGWTDCIRQIGIEYSVDGLIVSGRLELNIQWMD